MSLTFEYVPDAIALPEGAPPLLNAHGLTVDPSSGHIYFEYEIDTSTGVDPGSVQSLVEYVPILGDDGRVSSFEGTLIGDELLSGGTPHGLRIDPPSEALLHTNNNCVFRKTDIKGNVDWEVVNPPNNASEYWPYRPTDAVIAPPGSDNLYLTDGYGSSYVHLYSAATGEYKGLTFGGTDGDDPAAHGSLSCPHMITWDARPGVDLILIADRSNGRLEYYNLDGTYNSTLFDKGDADCPIQQPCDVNIAYDTNMALVPDLAGNTVVLDADGTIASVVNCSAVEGFTHPHDAVWVGEGADGFLVGSWNPGYLGYWRRVD